MEYGMVRRMALGSMSSFALAVTPALASNEAPVGPQQLLQQTVYITAFGTTTGGNIDQALTAAEAALPNGGKIIFPRAPTCYSLTAVHTIHNLNMFTYEGDNPQTCITANFDGDTFQIGDGTNLAAVITVRNLTFVSSVAKTTGGEIAIRNAYNTTLENVTCGGGAANNVCVDVHGGLQNFITRINNLQVPQAGQVGIRIGSGDTVANGVPADVFIGGGTIIGGQKLAGIEVSAGSGVNLDGTDAISNYNGLLVDPGPNQGVQALYTHPGVFLDTSTHEGLLLNPTSGGTIGASSFDSLWVATGGQQTGACGVRVEGASTTVRDIKFAGLRVFNGGGTGVCLNGGAYIDFASPFISYNGQKTANAYDGFAVAAGVSDWSVTNGRIGNASEFNATNQQRYGVSIAAGASDDYEITGDFFGNMNGSILDGGTGRTKKIEDWANGNVTWSLAGSTQHFGFGVGANASPAGKFTFVDQSRNSASADSGRCSLQLSVGTGVATEPMLCGGIDTTTNPALPLAWLQAIYPGVAGMPLSLNPNGGNVGVGTATPAYPLDVVGATRSTGSQRHGLSAVQTTSFNFSDASDIWLANAGAGIVYGTLEYCTSANAGLSHAIVKVVADTSSNGVTMMPHSNNNPQTGKADVLVPRPSGGPSGTDSSSEAYLTAPGTIVATCMGDGSWMVGLR